MRQLRGLWLSLVTAVLFVTPAAAQVTCYAPKWQPFVSPSLGITLEVSADVEQRYTINHENLVDVMVSERARPGKKVDGRCSSFNLNVIDFGKNIVTNVDGMLKAQADDMVKSNLSKFKVVRNRALTFQGLPAREVIFTYYIDYLKTPATRRYLLVVGGNKFYTFGWGWRDTGAIPADAARIYDSIQFTPLTPNPHARSQAMLEDTIREYWLGRLYPTRHHMSLSLRQIADSKRDAEKKMVSGYGSVQKVTYLRTEKGYRVFRIEHYKAVVDWYTTDDGRQISRLYWRKISDI